MKKVVILAANGRIARLVESRILTEEAFNDISLTLMLRNKERLSELEANPRVTLIEGDIYNLDDVNTAIKGQDLVFNTVVDHDDNNIPTKNIISAMTDNHVSRLVTTNILGIYDEVPGEFGRWNREYCFNGRVTPDNPMVVSDRLASETDGINNTTLRLPWLNDRSEIAYVLTHKHDEYIGFSGSRTSIADVVLKIMSNPEFASNDSLGIADPATQSSTRPVY